MNITLRKASAVQNSINEAIKGIEFKTEVKLNEFQDPENEITTASTILQHNLSRRQDLIEALYEIRKEVGQANARAGVDSRLAEVAFLDKQIQFYTDFAKKSVRESATVVAGKLDKIKNLKDEARSRIYGYADTVDTSVLTQNQLDQFRRIVAEHKKSKQKLQDEILELNVKTEIMLSAKTETSLQVEGLI